VTCGATVAQLRAGGPSIRSLHAQYKKKGFKFFLVCTREPHPGENILQPTIQERVKNALRLKKEEKVAFHILVDTPENTVRNVYRGSANGVFIINKERLLFFRASSALRPGRCASAARSSCREKAKARNELVRVCYSERLVGLLRNREISASMQRRAGRRRPRILLAYSRPKVNADKGGIRQSRFSTPNQFEHGSVRITDS
jgi:hypothetical protein